MLEEIKKKLTRAALKKLALVLLEKTRGKLTYTSVAALVIGVVSQLFGFDIAPMEVDILVTAGATLGAIYGRMRAGK